MKKTKILSAGKVKIGGNKPFVLVAGPCVIESRKSTLSHAEAIRDICRAEGVPFIFKSSYDKANRSNIKSYRGPGMDKGLSILSEVRKKIKVPVLSDVHCRSELIEASKVLDIIQIPAFLCRQTDFLVEAAGTGKIINVKKGQFLSPWDMSNVIEKIMYSGNRNIIVTERGAVFGYNNLVSDFRSLCVLNRLGYPVMYDATHSVQLPGGKGSCSGGQREFIPGLARSAIAMGCDGLFMEVHRNPDSAPCDGPNMISLKGLKKLLSQVKKIDGIVKC